MRLLIQASFLLTLSIVIIFCKLEDQKYKKIRYDTNDNEEEYTKCKEKGRYKSYNDENNERRVYDANRINKHKFKGVTCDKNAVYGYPDSFAKEKCTKCTRNLYKYRNDNEEKPIQKVIKQNESNKNKKVREENQQNNGYKQTLRRNVKEKIEDSQQTAKNSKFQKRDINDKYKRKIFESQNEDYTPSIEDNKNQKKQNKKWARKEHIYCDGEEDIKVINIKNDRKAKQSKNLVDDNNEEALQGKFFSAIKEEIRRRHLTTVDNGSNEKILIDKANDETEKKDQRDETEEGLQETCSKRSKIRKCEEKNLGIHEDGVESDLTSNESLDKKKIIYSVKFAHEKQKNFPSEENNIMKIHREKKKYKYISDDNEDDSNEEHIHPKRIHFLDEDEE